VRKQHTKQVKPVEGCAPIPFNEALLPARGVGTASPKIIVSLLFFADFVGKKQQRDRHGAAPQAHFCGVRPQFHHVI
jgi:hypothetical protein